MNNIYLKHTYRFFIYTLVIILFSSCTHNKAYDNLLNRVDSLMDSNEDSITAVLKTLHEIEPKTSTLPKSQKMRYQLLYHKAMNKAFVPFKSDSIMLQVVDYYQRTGSTNVKFCHITS